MDNYVVYHLHSDLSSGITNIDSVTKFWDYIECAKDLGMKALAFSEHGSVFSWVKKKQMIEAAGMKYIHAEEFYITKSLDEIVRDNYHAILIALNYDGVKEINKLSSLAFNKEDGHRYYMPRITFDELANTSDNVMITTACLGGILNSGDEDLEKRFLEFLVANKHRCYLEIQHHNVENQIEYNKKLYEYSKIYGIPLIAGTDTHALNDEHLKGREILQKSKKIFFENESGFDLGFKSLFGLIEAYKAQGLNEEIYMPAIEETNKMADRVEEFKMDYSYKYPHLWDDSEQYFRDKIMAGIATRGVDKFQNKDEYLARVEYEFDTYKKNGAIDFMLLMEDIVAWCKTQDIKIGYGRGSVNGSVIAWLLGITEMDSIKHNLNFERFMNLERVSLADIDTDFPPSRIGEVKDYIFSKHGLYCSDIVTFNTVADKGAIRDVARALEMDLKEVSEICATVDDEILYTKTRKLYPELFKYVDIIKGTIVSVGTHPCGLICSPHELDSSIGLFHTSTDEYPVSQIYMKEVDGLNYVKLDLLKLDTIEVISNTCKSAKIDMLTPDNMDVYDEAVWNSMRDDTTGIFQWEGTTGDKYIKELLSDRNIENFKKIDENVDRMTLLSIGNSAIRPAGASYRDDLASGVLRKSGSDAIDDFLKPTFGYLVFQCQIIEFLHSYCGFTMGEADIVRRHFAKKTGTDKDIPIVKDGGYLTDEHGNKSNHYIRGFVSTMKEMYGMSKEEAEETIVNFLRVIEDASRYLFSLNHSQPYSYEGYACAWLRYHYPLEFLTSLLNQNEDKEEKTAAVISYAKKVGVSIVPIKFRHSTAKYSFDKDTNSIYKGIASIKYMNSSVSEELNQFKHNEYSKFTDLLIDILRNTSINSRQLEILIKLDFFIEFGNSNKLMKTYQLFTKVWDKNKKIFKKQISKSKLSDYEITDDLVKAFCNKETDKTFMQMNMYGMLLEYEGLPFADVTSLQKASYQQLFLGDISIVDKKQKGCACVCSLNDKYTVSAKCYAIANGSVVDVKIPKPMYRRNTIEVGDIIQINNMFKKNKKMRDVDGKWVDDPNRFEWWISSYKKIAI